MKMQRLMKKMRRATALILAGLMIAMTVDISGLKVRAEEKQNNDRKDIIMLKAILYYILFLAEYLITIVIL